MAGAKVQKVGRTDAHEVDAVAVGPGFLLGNHLLERIINPVSIKVQRVAGGFGFFGRGAEAARNEFYFVVEDGGPAVHCPNEGVERATDLTHA